MRAPQIALGLQAIDASASIASETPLSVCLSLPLSLCQVIPVGPQGLGSHVADSEHLLAGVSNNEIESFYGCEKPASPEDPTRSAVFEDPTGLGKFDPSRFISSL